jgi:Pentapeptide repeats (8 copies)
MTTYEIRTLGGKVIHEVEVGDRKIAYPPDLHGLDFTNANLRGAMLPDANFEEAINSAQEDHFMWVFSHYR